MNICIWFYYILTLFILTEGKCKSLLKVLFRCWSQHWVHSRITLVWIFIFFFFLRICFIFFVLHRLVYLGLFYGWKIVEILDSVLFLLIKCWLLSGSYPNFLLKLSTLKTLYLRQQLQFRLSIFIMVSVYFTHSTFNHESEMRTDRIWASHFWFFPLWTFSILCSGQSFPTLVSWFSVQKYIYF